MRPYILYLFNFGISLNVFYCADYLVQTLADFQLVNISSFSSVIINKIINYRQRKHNKSLDFRNERKYTLVMAIRVLNKRLYSKLSHERKQNIYVHRVCTKYLFFRTIAGFANFVSYTDKKNISATFRREAVKYLLFHFVFL